MVLLHLTEEIQYFQQLHLLEVVVAVVTHTHLNPLIT
jgi:hypothetical protein